MITLELFLNSILSNVRSVFAVFSKRLALRIEQELTVFRYVLFCKPSRRTIIALALRITILAVSFLVFASIQLSSQYIESFWLNAVIMAVFMWVVASFLWEFGYTIQHVKRYSVWLLILMLLPLPIYISLYASSLDAESSQVTKRFNLNGFTFNSTASVRSKTKSTSMEDRWFELNFAQLGVLKVSYKKEGIAPLEEEAEAAMVGKALAYPNPFRVGQGTEIGYELSKDMDIQIQVYNMFGHMVRRMDISTGDEGARGDNHFNRVPFEAEDESGRTLSAGAYFYLIIGEGEVLGKGKMAVLP